MATALPLVGCKKKGTYNTETRPVVFATEALDGNFNPFFATSATDSEMASMTQVGMLTTDENGEIICGENEPTIARSYKVTEAPDQSYTDYEFVIKNGVKFSDGTDLTIKDVLFNLYVYLDPAYMGSATLYSTDIQGLKQYRTQDPEIGADQDESELNKGFYSEATIRINDIIDYVTDSDDASYTEAQIPGIQADIEAVKKEFRKEVESDWTMNQGTLESYEDEYTFTEDWQVYCYAEGLITRIKVGDKYLKDKDGKYITTITESAVLEGDVAYDSTYPNYGYYTGRVDAIIAAINAATTEEEKAQKAKEVSIDTVYNAYTTSQSQIAEILSFWATGANMLDQFVAEARTAYYEDLIADNDGGLIVPTISGISADTTKVDGKSHDVLKIRINDIDPKAIYNFSFAVAPMHYYSGEFEGKDYVKASNDELGTDPKNWKEFGVAFNNNRFFEEVLQANEKNKRPMGAGSYQTSSLDGKIGKDVDGDDFYSNNWVYFARNDYFDTVGGKGIKNAKIKYLRYKVVNSDKIIEALRAGDIDVGEPNATATNITTLSGIKHINAKTVDTNGYGYVGVNPKYVPDIEVRRAILMAMDTSKCLEYYTSANASILYRSMSTASWMWKQSGVTMPTSAYYPLATTDTVSSRTKKIQDRVMYDDNGQPTGWELNSSGKFYHKTDSKKNLELTFTIAGATNDHPAFNMFMQAAEWLNEAGFTVTVVTDVSALKKLATGQLEVWAAAWSSTVDPDMYQVYHKDSKATSVNNWGYPTILNDSTGEFNYENEVITTLSELIEQGRETNNKQTRAGIYFQALDLVMDLAVEMPTYQRKDCVAYNKTVIKASSLNKNATAFAGIIDKVWELDYN